MAAPSVTHTFTNNTTADGTQVSTNFTDLVNYVSNRNDGSATWDRCLVTSASFVPMIIDNSTGTSNIAIFRDNGTNVLQIVDGGDVYMAATKRLFLDGGDNTYVSESAADTITFVTGGGTAFTIDSSQGVRLQATKRLYLDGGGDTYVSESSANTVTFLTGGFTAFTLDSNQHAYLQATKRLYLDGGSNTYIEETSADLVQVVAGGTNGIRVDNSTTAGQTRLLLFDVDNNAMERVTIGAADSGGAGFKVLRIPN